jgi:hypothetical protein
VFPTASTDNVNQYLTRWTLSGSRTDLSFGATRATVAQITSFQWSYTFRDDSRLVGQVCGKLKGEGERQLVPLQIAAEYLDVDGKTVLGSWRDTDFACFDVAVNGSETVIVASNDGFVANSLCLVSCRERNHAQITDWGSQLVGEPFEKSAWSLSAIAPPQPLAESGLAIDWTLSPAFPFVCLGINVRLPYSQAIYQWKFLPYFPFYSSFQLTEAT